MPKRATVEQMNEWTFGFEFEFGFDKQDIRLDPQDAVRSNRDRIRTAVMNTLNKLRPKDMPPADPRANYSSWSVGSDGSIYDNKVVVYGRHHAVEIRSPAVQGNDALAYLKLGCALVRKIGTTGVLCGLHVHASHPDINSGTIDPDVLIRAHDDRWTQKAFIDHRYSTHYGWLDIPRKFACARPTIANARKRAAPPHSQHYRFELRKPGGLRYERRPMIVWNYVRHCVDAIMLAHEAKREKLAGSLAVTTASRWRRLYDKRHDDRIRKLVHEIRKQNTKLNATPVDQSLRD